MTAKIIDCIQGTEAWFAARRGIPTASCFSQILAKGEGKTRRSYLYKLAAEIVTGEVTEGYRNADMDRGHAMEDDARRLYAFMADVDPKLVGFIRNGDAGCSPDSLIGDDGVLEIKTQRADLLIATIFADVFPSEHVAQTQGALWITEREWIDVAIFWPKMPLFERFPLAFMPTGEPKKPLKIGIFDDLLAACPDIEPARIKIAMEDYCHGPRYLIEQVEGAVRVGLDGQATGAVTTHQQEGADSRLARYRHLPGDVCAKLLQKVEKAC